MKWILPSQVSVLFGNCGVQDDNIITKDHIVPKGILFSMRIRQFCCQPGFKGKIVARKDIVKAETDQLFPSR